VFIAGANLLDGFLRKNVYERVHLDESVQYTFSVTIKYIMLIIGVMIGLAALGVELAALTVFAGTIGIGIGFGLQDIAKNFISGLVMLVERPVKVGDYIEVSGLPGKVKAIKARSTIVDTFDNISVIVPNAEFMNQQVINWSYSDKITRLKLPVGVAYGTDPELVKATLLDAAKSHPDVLKIPEPYVWFTEFGNSSLNFELYIWTNEPNNRFTLKSHINFEINKFFKAAGIKIPFPQRDIHFKSTDVPLK
jgi:small-conductance mechanosensitive channel